MIVNDAVVDEDNMSLVAQLQQDQLQARKDKDQDRLSILQVVLADLKNEAINTGKELTDAEAESVIARQVKKLRDGLKDFESAGRSDLAEDAKQEIDVLETYLPEQLSDDELKNTVSEVISQVGATSPSDMGKIMGAVMSRVKGQADGNRVRAIVQELLS